MENDEKGSERKDIEVYNLLHLIALSLYPFLALLPFAPIVHIIFHATFAQIQNMRWCYRDSLSIQHGNSAGGKNRIGEIEYKKEVRGNLWIISLEHIQCGQLPKKTRTHTHIENHFHRYVSLSTTIKDATEQATKINFRCSFSLPLLLLLVVCAGSHTLECT